MSSNILIYYGLMFAAFCICLHACKTETKLRTLALLLFFSIIAESVVEICKFHKLNHRFVYHIYIPLEYIFLSFFLKSQAVSKRIKQIIAVSIPVYILLAIFLSFYIIDLSAFPGIHFNIEGLLLIFFVSIVFFNVEVSSDHSIFRLPFFWIAIGLLLFHSGLFFFNGVYNHLLRSKSDSAAFLQKIVNTNLNYLLYLFWIIGFLCSIRNKRYTIQ
jgi:hypothetical protein